MKSLLPLQHDRHVLVIGAGVSGLTSALCLRRQGFAVTVVAEQFAPQVTSVVAGALWEWPPAVCGFHQDTVSLARSKDWCVTSYNIFSDLAGNAETGVFMRSVVFYFKHKVEDSAREFEKMNELRPHVDDFRHSAALIGENEINNRVGLQDAYSHLAPMIDTDTYMAWLLKEVQQADCVIRQMKISGPLKHQEEQLMRDFDADIIVNCTGLGSRELTNDNLFPLRGALVRVRNDGRATPAITKAHCVTFSGSQSAQDMVFIVPRGRDMLLLGGLVQPHEWDLNIGLENYQPIRDMFERCVEFLPVLRDVQIDITEPVRVGLRPFRQGGVRLEHEPGTCIIHNYGHGGSGVTFSWGCALEVATIAETLSISDVVSAYA